MKNIFAIKAALFFLFLLCLSSRIYGQSDAFTGQRHNSSNETSASEENQNTGAIVRHHKKYYQDGKKLTDHELRDLLLKNPESAPLYHAYTTPHTLQSVFGGIGAGLGVAGGAIALVGAVNQVNHPLSNNGEAIQVAGLVVMVAGVAFLCVSIPFSIRARSKLDESVEKYNSNGTSYNDNGIKINMSMNISPTRIGLVMNF